MGKAGTHVRTPRLYRMTVHERAITDGRSTNPEFQLGVGANSSQPAKILVGVDGSAVYDAALEKAVRLCRALGAELHIITVQQRPSWQEVLALDVETPRPEVEEYFRELEHQLRATASHLGACVGSVKVSKGDPGNAILKHIKRISPDMVVLCRKRRPGADLWGMTLGSTSKKVSCRSPCPVVLVPCSSG